MVKARYTLLQSVVLAADEEVSPYRAVLERRFDDIGGHAGRHRRPCTRPCRRSWPASTATVAVVRVAYVMTDGGALPAWFSYTLDALAGRLAGVITVGQAFGGDLEATNRLRWTARGPGTPSGPTWRWSVRARATSAPVRPGASPAPRSARR